MSAKDYRIIAAALAEARPEATRFARKDQWNATVAAIAAALAADNPNFDPDRFLEACNA